MRVTVISPERALFDGEASSVVAPAFDGQVGILPRHAPFMTLLGEGVVRIRVGGAGAGAAMREITVSGGFLQVSDDAVRIVAGSATERQA